MPPLYKNIEPPPSVVALGSGQGSTISFFCEKSSKATAPFRIKALVTENPSSGLWDVARRFKLPCHLVPFKGKESFAGWDREMCRVLAIYKPRLILLAGFLKKIGPRVLSRFEGCVINSHPSLLPEFSGPGMYGRKVHEAVVRAGKKQTGISIHIVTAQYDKGPILAQCKIPVAPADTAEGLQKKVKKIEKEFYFATVARILKEKA